MSRENKIKDNKDPNDHICTYVDSPKSLIIEGLSYGEMFCTSLDKINTLKLISELTKEVHKLE